MDEQDWLSNSGLSQANQYAQLYDQSLDWPADNQHQLFDTDLQQIDVPPKGHQEQRLSPQSICRNENYNKLSTPDAGKSLKHLRSPFHYHKTTSEIDPAQDNLNGISWLDADLAACHEPFLELRSEFDSQADEGKISQLQRDVRDLKNEIQYLRSKVVGHRDLRCGVNNRERGEISQLQREIRDFKIEMGYLKSTATEDRELRSELDDLKTRTLPEIAEYITSFRGWVVTQLTMDNPSTTVASTTSGIRTDIGLWSDEDGDNNGLVTPKGGQSPLRAEILEC